MIGRNWLIKTLIAATLAILILGGWALAQTFDKWDLSIAVKYAAETLSPAVVSVETRFDKPRRDDDYIMWDYFRGPRPRYGLFGSGFFYRDKYVITCDKITDNMEYGKVVLSDGRSYPATLLGTNETFRVSVLEVDLPANFDYVRVNFLDSDDILLGMPIALVGRSVNGLDTFATEGIISAIRKKTIGSEIPTEEFIQFDANFELTFLGGPLADIEGNVLGMVYWTEGINLNLAVPINDVLNAADKIIAGDMRVPWFGGDVTTRSQNIDIIYDLEDLPFDDGLLVTYVEDNSPADIAGLRSGNIIESVDGQRFEFMNEWKMIKRRFSIGQQIRIVYWYGVAPATYARGEVIVTILADPEALEEEDSSDSEGSSGGGYHNRLL